MGLVANALGNAIGGLYGIQNRSVANDYSQQMMRAQQDALLAQQYNTGYSTSGGTLTISPNITIAPYPPSPPSPATAVEWLDRRVEEMRVKL